MATLAGTVVDQSGRPVTDAIVGTLVTWNGDYRNQGRWVKTDASGRFEIQTGHVSESLTVEAFSSEHGGSQMQVESPAAGKSKRDLKFTLPGAQRVRGVVVDEQGRGIPDVLCEIDGPGRTIVFSDAQGKFDFGQMSLRAQGVLPLPAVTFQPPRPSRGFLRIAMSDQMLDGRNLDAMQFYREQETVIPPAAAGNAEMKVVLGRTQLLHIRGQFVDHDGHAVANAVVYLFAGNAGDQWHELVMPKMGRDDAILMGDQDKWLAGIRSDNNGQFDIPIVRADGEATDKGTKFSIGIGVGGKPRQLVKDLLIPSDAGALDLKINVDAVTKATPEPATRPPTAP
jgi:protocatechuate 3,4-dioxygenase beta subunit